MNNEAAKAEDLTLLLVEERAAVSKLTTETGRVSIATHVEEHRETIREALRHDGVVVERVQINQVVNTAPVVRREGDTLIYPIVEETLVVEKRFLLKEEIHIICTSRVEMFEQDVTLRAMHADVQRTPTPPTPED